MTRLRRQRPGRGQILAFSIAFGLLMAGLGNAGLAATTEQVVVDRNSGLAIYGFDPVSYFTDG